MPNSETIQCKECIFNQLFDGILSKSEIMALSEHKSGRMFSKGEIIIQENDPVTHFIYLNSGLVKVYINGKKKNNDRIISISKPMDCIGLMSIFSNSNHIYSISAIEDSLVCFIELKIIREIAEKNGKFALCFLEKVSQLSDNFLINRIELAAKHMRGRVASIFLFFSKTIYNQTEFELPVSRKEIAELVELRTENVIRVISEFRKDNLLYINGKSVVINNMEELEKISRIG